jgi:acyl-CoA reductase-like NAD-dependent aldehyde dehydrogenase
MKFTLTIDGRAETSAASFDVVDPSNGEPFARCPDASRSHLDRAVGAARRAFGPWSALSFEERRTHLLRFAEALEKDAETLAPLLTRETGKPLAAARAEIGYASAHLRRLSAIGIESEILRDDAAGRIELRYRPLGVVGILTPWNVPAAIAMGRIAQALYTGNTAVQKPSPFAPLTALAIGEIARHVLPAGVLNVVAGGAELGGWIAAHPDIDKISFTGSVATGKKILAAAAGNLKRVTLELGGNDAAIVLDDVAPETVAPRLFWAAFANCGQICVAIKRLYVPERIYGPMCEVLADIARRVKVGGGFEPGVEIGPIQNAVQYARVLEILEDTKRTGARILCGGHALDRPGYFIAPTVVADIREGTRLVDEEPFGPILPVLRYADPEDAIRRANATRYGLGGSVWTKDPERGAAIAARLEVGTAWVNQHVTPEPSIPFGGAKESGLGREYAALGLKNYMEAQVVSVAGL